MKKSRNEIVIGSNDASHHLFALYPARGINSAMNDDVTSLVSLNVIKSLGISSACCLLAVEDGRVVIYLPAPYTANTWHTNRTTFKLSCKDTDTSRKTRARLGARILVKSLKDTGVNSRFPCCLKREHMKEEAPSAEVWNVL